MWSNTRSEFSVQYSTGTLPLTVVAPISSRSGWSAREHQRDGVVGAGVDIEDQPGRHARSLPAGRVRMRAGRPARRRPQAPTATRKKSVAERDQEADQQGHVRGDRLGELPRRRHHLVEDVDQGARRERRGRRSTAAATTNV